jgi:hypothetical protein
MQFLTGRWKDPFSSNSGAPDFRKEDRRFPLCVAREAHRHTKNGFRFASESPPRDVTAPWLCG